MNDSPAGSGRIRFSDSYTRTVVLLLTLAYTLNSADRTLIAIIGQALKLDLKISDAQLGALIGTAFATLYAFSGLPIARLAERFNRVVIISTALAVWSTLTALCGLAANFTQLFLIRMAVGVGEAGCTPPAHSLISDYVSPGRRSTALSIYSCGISFGYIFSAVVGGYMTLHFGWRAACWVIGLPGIAVALLLKQAIREPPRGNSEQSPNRAAATAATAETAANPQRWYSHELREMAAVAKTLFLKRPIANIFAGLTIATFAAQGSYAFVPAYFNRAFGLDYGTIGIISGLTGGVAVGLGLAAGGFVTDFLGARHAKWYAAIPAIGLTIAMPLYVLAILQTDWTRSAWILAFAGFFQYVSFGPTFGVMQNVASSHRRATTSAVIYIFLTVLGLGCGPPFTGWLIDQFAQFNFSHHVAGTVMGSFGALRDSVPAGVPFRVACTAGHALAAATSTEKAACQAALALSSREGIIVTVLLYGWAALHYLCGAFGLAKEMRA